MFLAFDRGGGGEAHYGHEVNEKKKRLRILSASEKREQGGVIFLCTFSKV